MSAFDTMQRAIEKDDWWKQLIPIIGIPTILSFFAYTYVVGYFLASDIAWFTFFSFSDHVLFALRALPIVACASIVFITVYPNWESYKWLVWCWYVALVLFSLWSIATSHIVIGVIIGLMVWLDVSRRFYKSFVEPPIFIYWIVTLMVSSIIMGFISASAWMYLPFAHLPPAPVMVLELKEPLSGENQQKILVGHTMFSGEKMILFYEHSVGTHLLKLDEIKHIEQCLHGTLLDDAYDDKGSRHKPCQKQ